MKKVLFIFLKLFAGFIGLVLIFCLVLAGWLFLEMKNEHKSAKNYLANDKNTVVPEVKQKIYEQTLFLYDQNQAFIGRGFLHLSKYIITNRHIADRFCIGSGNCQKNLFYFRSQGTAKNPIRVKTKVENARRNVCLNWLDLCVFDLQINPQKLSKGNRFPTSQTVYVSTFDDFDEGLFRGSLVGSHESILTYEIPSRRGFSGGPLFNKKAELVGIAFASTSRSFVNFPDLFRTNPYKLTTLVISMETIVNLIYCFENKTLAECVGMEKNLYKRLKDSLEVHGKRLENETSDDILKDLFYYFYYLGLPG